MKPWPLIDAAVIVKSDPLTAVMQLRLQHHLVKKNSALCGLINISEHQRFFMLNIMANCLQHFYVNIYIYFDDDLFDNNIKVSSKKNAEILYSSGCAKNFFLALTRCEITWNKSFRWYFFIKIRKFTGWSIQDYSWIGRLANNSHR